MKYITTKCTTPTIILVPISIHNLEQVCVLIQISCNVHSGILVFTDIIILQYVCKLITHIDDNQITALIDIGCSAVQDLAAYSKNGPSAI